MMGQATKSVSDEKGLDIVSKYGAGIFLVHAEVVCAFQHEFWRRFMLTRYLNSLKPEIAMMG